MRELQIVESIVDQIFRQVQESGDKRVNHLQLALDEPSKLDQSPFQAHWKSTAKVRSRNRHNCTSVLSLLMCNVCRASKNISLWTKNLLPILPLPGVSAQES